jgi:hypothetical protein
MPITKDNTKICFPGELKWYILSSLKDAGKGLTIDELTCRVIEKKVKNGLREPRFKDEKNRVYNRVSESIKYGLIKRVYRSDGDSLIKLKKTEKVRRTLKRLEWRFGHPSNDFSPGEIGFAVLEYIKEKEADYPSSSPE